MAAAGRPGTDPGTLDLHLEVNEADAVELGRDLLEGAADPETAVRGTGSLVSRAAVVEANEADLAEQWLEVDDDLDDRDR